MIIEGDSVTHNSVVRSTVRGMVEKSERNKNHKRNEPAVPLKGALSSSDAVSSPARVATKAGERSAKNRSDDVIAVHLYPIHYIN